MGEPTKVLRPDRPSIVKLNDILDHKFLRERGFVLSDDPELIPPANAKIPQILAGELGSKLVINSYGGGTFRPYRTLVPSSPFRLAHEIAEHAATMREIIEEGIRFHYPCEPGNPFLVHVPQGPKYQTVGQLLELEYPRIVLASPIPLSASRL